MNVKKQGKEKGKPSKIDGVVVFVVSATFNNTVITAYRDEQRTVIGSCSGGSAGFKNARKGTSLASETAIANLAAKIQKRGATQAKLVLKGLGSGRESAHRILQDYFKLLVIQDKTPIAHNGTRLRKQRRS